MKKLLLAGLVGLSVSVMVGCVSRPTYPVTPMKQERPMDKIDFSKADYGKYPENYKAIIENAAKDILKDPDSAKFSDWFEPKKEVMFENSEPLFGYSVCFSLNAKNSYGGYTGKKPYWAMIKNGVVKRMHNTNEYPYKMIFIGHDITCQ